MTPSPRTTHQRDRRFARVRMLTRTIFVGSGVLSVGMVGYLASVTKLHTTTHPTPPTTAPVATTTVAPAGATGSSGAVAATTTTTVPVTTTTTCYTSPSGNTLCN
ncbi:MAG: hypothetical protein PXZ08_07285 [Actinomycetota bacterium]|nr:hypothetical protein [Actinomycetota bacterium]